MIVITLLKGHQQFGLPSGSIVLSELEVNTALTTNGFVKKGRLSLPVELDSALYGPGVFDTINTMDAPAASQEFGPDQKWLYGIQKPLLVANTIR